MGIMGLGTWATSSSRCRGRGRLGRWIGVGGARRGRRGCEEEEEEGCGSFLLLAKGGRNV